MQFPNSEVLKEFNRFKHGIISSKIEDLSYIEKNFSDLQRIEFFCLIKKHKVSISNILVIEKRIWKEIHSVFRNDYNNTEFLLERYEQTLEMAKIALLLELLDYEDFRSVLKFLYQNTQNYNKIITKINIILLQILQVKGIKTKVLPNLSSLLRFLGIPPINVEVLKDRLYSLFPEDKNDFDAFYELPINSCQKYPEYLDEIAEQLDYDNDIPHMKKWLTQENLFKLERSMLESFVKSWEPKKIDSIEDLVSKLDIKLRENNLTSIPIVFNSFIKPYCNNVQPKKIIPHEITKNIPSEILNSYVEKLAFSSNNHRDNKIKVTFLSGSQIGTMGILITTSKSNILIDYGLSVANFQLPYYDEGLNHLDAVLVTHAHLDHIGAVPYLYGQGYSGYVFGSGMTKNIANFLLMDSLELMRKNVSSEIREKDHRFKYLSQSSYIYQMLDHYITIKPENEYQITPDIIIRPINANHIQGSLAYQIKSGNKKILFSGDINLDSTALFGKSTPILPTDANLTIIDSTYYGQPEFDSNTRDEILFKNVKEGNKVIIPAFSVGRAQEILIKLDKKGLTKERKITLLGMATKVARITGLKTNGYLSDQLIQPFDDEIIIAGGGMLGGGFARDLVEQTKNDPNTTIILCGFLAKNTLGYRLLHDLEPQYKQKVVFTRFSGHSSGKSLDTFINSLKDKKALVHVGDLTTDPFNANKIRKTELYKNQEFYFPEIGSSIEI